MSAREFEITAPGKIALAFPLFIGAVLPLLLLTSIATTAKTSTEWLSALPALLLMPVIALLLAWRMHRRTLRLENGVLEYGRFRWHRTPVANLDLDLASIVNLAEHRELQPVRRITGAAMPGYRAGLFRLRDRRRGYVVVTDSTRVLVLPKLDKGVLLFSVARPDALLAALRQAAGDKGGSAR